MQLLLFKPVEGPAGVFGTADRVYPFFLYGIAWLIPDTLALFVQAVEGILEDILADGVILLFQLAVVIEAAPDAYGVFRIEAHNQRIPVTGSRFRRYGYIGLMSVHAWEGIGLVADIKGGGHHLIQNQCFIPLQQPLRLNLALVDNIITACDMGNEGRLNICLLYTSRCV